MFFNFTFRNFLTNPRSLAVHLEESEMRGFRRRILLIFVLGIVLYGLRSFWGMNTESLTPILASGEMADYTIARVTALVGSVIWSVIYIAFHLFGFAYILSLMTGIRFRKLVPMQLLMMFLLLMEKVLILLVFYMTNTTASVSFLSFGPLAATFLEVKFLILFFNQLTLTTAIIISYQYHFIRQLAFQIRTNHLLWALIGLHTLMAIFTACVGLLPLENLFHSIIGGGGTGE